MSAILTHARRLVDAGRYAEAEEVLAAAPETRVAGAEADLLRHVRLLRGRVATPEDPVAALRLARALMGLLGAPPLQGSDEGARLDRAATLLRQAVPGLPPAERPLAARLLWRLALYDEAEALGELSELGQLAVEADAPGELLRLLPRVRNDADRRRLLALHRAWGRQAAAGTQAVSLPSRAGSGPIRLGFLSADLRHHVVAYFVQPLFAHPDPRFELFGYTPVVAEPDQVQRWFIARSRGFVQLPADDDAAAAEIARDGIDILVDLSGPTSVARPGVLARRPARRILSWLGYPHSLGLEAVSGFIGDPHLTPDGSGLLEPPVTLPESYICMAPAAFADTPAPAAPPAGRKGVFTFGTANDPYKFSPRLLKVWARIVAATPGARFMIVRPECGSSVFRAGVAARFAEAGVPRDRLDFWPLRGAVRPAYADIDLALDTFPLAGGTTTCDALWMGVPTVTLAGPAPFERLGASILANAGLDDFIARDEAGYIRIATDWAGRQPELAALRSSLRGAIRSRTLGQPERFARQFYDAMAALAGQA